MKLDPISNESVVNEIFKRITDSIINGEIKPGEKLPTEVELMQKLGVGRNSIREAVKMLTAMGVLEVKRGNGTYVATKVTPAIFNPLVFSMILEPKTAYDLYELRMMFENMVLLLDIEKATQEDLDEIEGLLLYARELAEKGNTSIDEFVKLDMDFHIALIKSTHNPLVERIGKTIIELFPKYIKNSISQRNGVHRSINNHFEILQLIRDRDKSKVYELVEKTLEEWKNQWKDEF